MEDNKVNLLSVSFTIGWLPGAICLTEAAKDALAAARGIDKKVIRGNYAILGASKDSLIKQGASLKRLLVQVRDEFTIPEYTIKQTAAGLSGSKSFKPEKVGGSYLIEQSNVGKFFERFEDVRKQYLEWGARVSEPHNYERIKNADMLALSQDWHIIASKYPTAEQMADAINCDSPRFEPFNSKIHLEHLAPETANRLRVQAENRLSASIEGATTALISDFREVIEAVTKSCGHRTRLLPIDPKWAHLRNAEVVSLVSHEENEDVPEGSLMLTLQQVNSKQSAKGDEKFVAAGKPITMVLTSADYANLKPYSTSEYKHLTQASFDSLMWTAKKIVNVQETLASAKLFDDGDTVINMAKDVENLLASMGDSSSDITKQLKNSSYARKAASETFSGLLTQIRATEIKVKETNKKRRKIRMANA